MKELIDSILRYGTLSSQDIELIKIKAQLKITKKGDCFLEVGKIARQVGFVTEGVLRVCFYDENGTDITRAFIPENHFALNIASFNNQTPSEVCFKAVSNCKLLVFSEKALSELEAAIPGWKEIMYKIGFTALSNKLKITCLFRMRKHDILNF